ncbi:sensor histidine kinase [Neptuniibacter sp. SY11_33]|uniref:sensor histidine kinase n=1 Tax=Neptuniibacter sp. SY11_33 TaxID=3398215 RepID=UPI0039F493E3
MTDAPNPFKQAYERERKARLEAEHLLEEKSRELYQKNQHLEQSYEQLKKQQALMLQNEKLATLGTLSAGVAHEINNPVAFIKSNVESLKQYFDSYNLILAEIKQLLPRLPEDQKGPLAQLLIDEDIDFISEDIPQLMEDTQEGLQRVKDIVQNLRSFSRTQASDHGSYDLLEGINSTLKLLQSELKNSVALDISLEPLPKIECNLNELNQVFLNLIMNAKHATVDSQNPCVSVRSKHDDQYVYVEIADNGCGISEEVQKDIFTPFFTTKPVGQGTGMGLAISHNIIKKHNGEIQLQSKTGEGTTFTIKLPIN